MASHPQTSIDRLGALAAAAVVVMLGIAPAAVAVGPDQDVGQKFTIRPNELPPPFATPSASNSSTVVRRPPGASLKLPAGFSAGVFA